MLPPGRMDKNYTDDDMMSTSDNDIDLTVVQGQNLRKERNHQSTRFVPAGR